MWGRPDVARALLLATLFAIFALIASAAAKASPPPPTVAIICGPAGAAYTPVCGIEVEIAGERWCVLARYAQSPDAMQLLAAGTLHRCSPVRAAHKTAGPSS